jgi:hypothetical protein
MRKKFVLVFFYRLIGLVSLFAENDEICMQLNFTYSGITQTGYGVIASAPGSTSPCGL